MWVGGIQSDLKGAARQNKLIADGRLVVAPHDGLQHRLQPLQCIGLICEVHQTSEVSGHPP